MAPTLTYTHASGLNAAIRALRDMHQTTLRSADGGGVRLSIANIVTAGLDAASVDAAATVVAHLGERHPARTIVILADPEGPEHIEADISLHQHGGEQAVATELIRLSVGGPPALHLASIVTPLLAPDIPLYLWLAGAPRLAQAFEPETVAMCERIILDTACYPDAHTVLAQLRDELRHHGGSLRLGDISWIRTESWRQLAAQTFDNPEALSWLPRLRSVEVGCAGDKASTQAWLLSGWLNHRLAAVRGGRPLEVTCVAGGGDTAALGDLTFVRCRCDTPDGPATVLFERAGETLHTLTTSPSGAEQSRHVTMRRLDEVDLVGGLMSETGTDNLYLETLAHAAALSE